MKLGVQTLSHTLVKMIPLTVFCMTDTGLMRAAIQQHHQHFCTGTALKAFSLKYDHSSSLFDGM